MFYINEDKRIRFFYAETLVITQKSCEATAKRNR